MLSSLLIFWLFYFVLVCNFNGFSILVVCIETPCGNVSEETSSGLKSRWRCHPEGQIRCSSLSESYFIISMDHSSPSAADRRSAPHHLWDQNFHCPVQSSPNYKWKRVNSQCVRQFSSCRKPDTCLLDK
jgi:hypothetical protein